MMSIFASIHLLIWISSFESIKCLKGSPVSLAVVNRDTNLNLNYSEEITTETTTENPNDIMLRSGPHEPEEENKDTSKTIIIVVVMIVFILLTIFNHVIVPKVNFCHTTRSKIY